MRRRRKALRRGCLLAGAAASLLVALGAVALGAAAQVERPTLVSREDGRHGARIEGGAAASISGSGRYVAFVKSKLILLRDVLEARTRYLDEGAEPDLSASGRYLAYIDGKGQVYVRDLKGRGKTLVSRQAYPDATPGPGADGRSRAPSISADGRYVAFASVARNLVDEDGDRRADIPTGSPLGYLEQVYLRDLHTKETTLVSRRSGARGKILNTGLELEVAISATGRHLAFRGGGLFHRDLRTDRTLLLAEEGSQPAISADGQRVAYIEDGEVLVRDLRQNSPRSVLPRAGRATAATPSLSADGRYLAFQINPGYGSAKLYLRDLRLGASAFVDRGGNRASSVDLSADGRYLAYDTLKALRTGGPRGSDAIRLPPPDYIPAEATASFSPALRYTAAVYRVANPFE